MNAEITPTALILIALLASLGFGVLVCWFARSEFHRLGFSEGGDV